jgi:AcrR family transcriptional regulator
MASALDTARRTQAERRDESQRLLVEATMRVVAEQGVGAATFDEIGRAAGYSRGLATQKFGSKRGLTEAVIAHLHHERHSLAMPRAAVGISAFDAIVHLIDTQLSSVREDDGSRAYFRLLSAAVADASPLRDIFAGAHEEVRAWLRKELTRGQAAGEILREVDPDAAALMIGSLLLGVSIQVLVDPTADVDAIRAEAVATLRRSLLLA